jgi:hypothetical protein
VNKKEDKDLEKNKLFNKAALINRFNNKIPGTNHQVSLMCHLTALL